MVFKMKVLKYACLFLYVFFLIPFTVLGFSSWFRYSTFGFDFEQARGQVIEVTYYRLRWDDGSIWAGWAVQQLPNPNRPLDWFDPGGTLLDEPTLPERKTWMNHLGFWWIDHPNNDPYVFPRYGGAHATFWLGAPTWLVLLVFWLPVPWWVATKPGRIAPKKGAPGSIPHKNPKPTAPETS